MSGGKVKTSNLSKSRHFTVNGLLSANNTLQQQQQNQYNLQPSNDSRNIYNNPYIPPQQQQQQQQLQQQTQQRTAHLFKALAASAGGTNSLTHPYDFSNSSTSSNANNEHQGSSSSEAENAFLTHNNERTPSEQEVNESLFSNKLRRKRLEKECGPEIYVGAVSDGGNRDHRHDDDIRELNHRRAQYVYSNRRSQCLPLKAILKAGATPARSLNVCSTSENQHRIPAICCSAP
ncbi:GM22090 [Drosophila sechellia]|uniref:GM22090 n=1 Tax=Drosophila sechellia TaxID=7238 RepID=B4IB15_DROSE|nr:GM22090 [Drosophila sechellia]